MPYIGRSTDGFGVRNRFLYLASANDTSVSGADANGATLTFTDGAYVDVYLNGVLLKAGTDYNTNTANTIASLAAMAANDEVTVVVYDVFTVGDMVSATSGGTFVGNVTHSGTVTFGSTVSGLDVNGTEIILDADADTSITADTDDQIDVKVGGTDTIKIEPDAVTILGPHPDLNLQDSDDNNTGGVYYNDGRITLAADNGAQHSGSSLVLSVDGTARMTVDSGGDVDIETGDIFFSTAGKGINLGVTSNTDSNTLDDYEEGAWTLGDASGGVTFAQEDGYYIKIGRQVSAYAFVNFPTTSHSGVVQINGLPFTIANEDAARGGGNISFQDASASNNITVIGVKNTQQIEFYGGTGANFVNSNFSAKSIYFAIHYYTAA